MDKYWLVKECRDDGTVLLVTRRGKEHLVREDSPNLRHANWWERFVHRNRFPEIDPATGNVVVEEPAGIQLQLARRQLIASVAAALTAETRLRIIREITERNGASHQLVEREQPAASAVPLKE